MAVPFLFGLLVTGGLWWATWRYPGARPFWGWLAAGWTLNQLGNIAWIAHDLLTGSRLPPLSWIDLLYVARYVCVGLAFWRYPTVWERQKLWEVGGLILLAALALWVGVYRTELAEMKRPWSDFVGVAIYPVLDVALIYVVAARWREVAQEAWKRTLFLLLLATLAYGIANGINFCVRMTSVASESAWATLCWLLTDVLVAAAAGWFFKSGPQDTGPPLLAVDEDRMS